MKTDMLRAALTLGLMCTASAVCLGADRPARKDLGRSVKLTILVDKVMQPENDWVTQEWMVKEAAEAGFNVYSPRVGYEKLDEVRQVTKWCEKYGMYHMPWMRGSLSAPKGPEADGKRLVWANGNEQPLWSPNSDEFWEWTHKYIVEYAKMSAENKTLMGVFLDYENYAPGRQGNCYSLSYDDIILDKFARAKGIDLPELPLDQRKSWLEEKGLHDEFAEFQVNHWRERCRALRKAVDEHDPTFQFCIYPAPGTPFIIQATYPEWATEQAPLILADACTYGRPSRFISEAEAVQRNRERLLARMEVPKEAGIPFIYAGGIDPVVKGADPEFCGKNAVMICDVTDGYWIFYEGPKYKEDHPEYFKWFTWANKAIAEGNFQAQHQPRETPENFALDIFGKAGEGMSLVAPKVTGEEVEFPVVKLRGENILLLAVKAGQPVEVVLKDQPVARYTSMLVWDLRDAKLAKIESGTIPHDGTGTISFTPEEDGIYLLGASAGSCAYSVVSSNAPVGLYTGEGLSLIYGAQRLYFRAPEGVQQFTLSAKGAGAETVRVNVLDPEGNEVANGQTTLKQEKVEIPVDVGDNAGKVWSLQVTKAAEGVLEDNTIRLDPKLPPALSLVPEQVFDVAPKR